MPLKLNILTFLTAAYYKLHGQTNNEILKKAMIFIEKQMRNLKKKIYRIWKEINKENLQKTRM